MGMSENRHPAGTAVGGQWAPGSYAEIDLDDALDDTFGFEPEPEHDHSDGTLGIGTPGAAIGFTPRDLPTARKVGDMAILNDVGDMQRTDHPDGKSHYVLAADQGYAVLFREKSDYYDEDSDEPHESHDYTVLRYRRTPDTNRTSAWDKGGTFRENIDTALIENHSPQKLVFDSAYEGVESSDGADMFDDPRAVRNLLVRSTGSRLGRIDEMSTSEIHDFHQTGPAVLRDSLDRAAAEEFLSDVSPDVVPLQTSSPTSRNDDLVEDGEHDRRQELAAYAAPDGFEDKVFAVNDGRTKSVYYVNDDHEVREAYL